MTFILESIMIKLWINSDFTLQKFMNDALYMKCENVEDGFFKKTFKQMSGVTRRFVGKTLFRVLFDRYANGPCRNSETSETMKLITCGTLFPFVTTSLKSMHR